MNDKLLFPQPGIGRFFFGGIFLGIASTGLYYSIRHTRLFGGAWDCYDNGFIVMFVVSFLFMFYQKICEFQKQDQSMIIYWGIGLPFNNLFMKLPLIWHDYSGKRISKLKISRKSRRVADDYPGETRTHSYPIEAKIGRQLVYIAEYGSLERSIEKSESIGEFLGIPVENKVP